MTYSEDLELKFIFKKEGGKEFGEILKIMTRKYDDDEFKVKIVGFE